MRITVTHHPHVDAMPYVPGRKYGIVKVSQVYPPDYTQDTVAGAVAMQDRTFGKEKGNSIPIFNYVWAYLEKINTDPRATPFWESEGWLWINIPYKEENKTPRCESVMSPGNIVSWDEETYTHVKLPSFDCAINTSVLNPDKDNWMYRPDLFWKATSYTRKYEINNVGNGIDAYTMRIRNSGTNLWMHKDSIEEFPVRPNYQYRIYGTDIYNGNEPLMKVIGNKRAFYRSDWRMTAPSVIPPAGWNL